MLFLQHRCNKFHSQFQSIQNSTRIKNSALTLQFRGNPVNLQIFNLFWIFTNATTL